MDNVYLYIAVMALVTYAIRVLPLTLIRRPVTNRTLRSFLYYVPYVTLSVMTFPAIIEVTGNPLVGAGALVIAVVLAYRGFSLFPVAVAACSAVFFAELVMRMAV